VICNGARRTVAEKCKVHHPSSTAATNRLLRDLSRQEREELLEKGEHVELILGNVLCEPDESMRYALFPTSGAISLMACAETNASLELIIVGDEGMLGLPLVFGTQSAPLRALVHGSGMAWRITASGFRHTLERSKRLQRVLYRYLDVLVRQAARTALCAHFHAVEARLARSLLTTSDRMHADEFYMTQECISTMLGVRRPGVNHAASVLRDRKLIRYCRGQLTILDRRGLQAAACSCYAATKRIYSEMLG
jgi:CRP-like cAMP-binding protein